MYAVLRRVPRLLIFMNIHEVACASVDFTVEVWCSMVMFSGAQGSASVFPQHAICVEYLVSNPYSTRLYGEIDSSQSMSMLSISALRET